MTREGEPEDELPTNVIAFPKARAEADKAEQPPAPAEAEPAATSDAERPAPDESEGPTMTLDAFERAVRAAVRDKLGDEPSSPPRGADELVAQVFSALTGKDAKSALAEVRSRLSEPLDAEDETDRPAPGDDAAVIDLASIREARQRQSLEAASKVGNAIKDTVAGFIANLAQRQGHTGEITLDTNFFKQHGPTLLGNLFQGLAASFMQQARGNLSPTPTPPSDPPPPVAETEPAGPTGASAAESPPAEPGAQPPQAQPGEAQPNDAQPKAAQPASTVQVRLDVGSLLAGLFKRLGRPTQPPDEPQR